MSHKFRTHTWAKRKWTSKDHMHFLMNSTNAQRSFIHEVSSQMLGHPPSKLWGGVPIPNEFRIHGDPETLNYVRTASKHAPHEFGRLISSHKKGGNWATDLVEAVQGGAKAAAKYGGKAVAWGIEHGDQIKTATSVLKNVVQTGTQIAQISGLMSGNTADSMDAIAAALEAHTKADVYKSKPKKGARFDRILI